MPRLIKPEIEGYSDIDFEPEPAPKPYNPAETDYLTQRGASIAHQHHRSSEYVFEAGAGPRARDVHNRALSHTSHTATRPLRRPRGAYAAALECDHADNHLN
jgi:hypothetical protein